MRSLLARLFVVLVACLACAPAWADKRVALVVGISKYQNVPALGNPSNDASAMGDIFKSAGFDTVDLRRDLGVADMRKALREFAAKASDADIAVVYYAGHGIEVDGANYLVPADAKLLSDFDVEDEAVSLDRVLQAIYPAKRLRLVILDACRDNPFSKTMKRSVANRSIGRGLAKIEPATTDTLIAFAAKAGAVASDGDGRNSPFTTAMIKHIASPGLDLRLAFGRVRDDVLRGTGNRQEPFVYGSLGGETVALVPAALAAAVAPAVDPNAEARRDYEFAAQIGTKEAWSSFLATHSAGIYANLARAARDKLDAAERASTAATESQRKAEDQAKQKADEFRKQLEAQAAQQALDTRKQLSEQSRRELEQARQEIADQAKRELDEARRQAANAQKQAEDARKQVDEAKAQGAIEAQKRVEEAKRDAAEKAKQEMAKLAALNPGSPAETRSAPAAPPMDAADIARLLQAHLKRVGCDPGATEGVWNDRSKKALEDFNKRAGTKLDVKVASLDSLDAVRAKSDRVCPLVCAKGQKADGERCVQITCEAGFVLRADGTCGKKPEAVARVKPAVRTGGESPPARGGGGGKCFSFNGKQYCE
jgi:uncharacterized caspase-like protein